MSLSIEEVTLSNLDKVMADIAFWFDPSMQCAPNLTNPYPPKGYVKSLINDNIAWPYAGFDSDLNMYTGLAIIAPNTDPVSNVLLDVRWSWIVAQPYCFIDFTMAMVSPVLNKIERLGLQWHDKQYLWAAVTRSDIADLARAHRDIREVSSDETFPPNKYFKDNSDVVTYTFCFEEGVGGNNI
jgi:hypothetical protein